MREGGTHQGERSCVSLKKKKQKKKAEQMYTRHRLGHCNDNATQKCNCTNICRGWSELGVEGV